MLCFICYYAKNLISFPPSPHQKSHKQHFTDHVNCYSFMYVCKLPLYKLNYLAMIKCTMRACIIACVRYCNTYGCCSVTSECACVCVRARTRTRTSPYNIDEFMSVISFKVTSSVFINAQVSIQDPTRTLKSHIFYLPLLKNYFFSWFAADYKLYKFKLEKQHDTKTFGVTFGGR